MFCSWLVTLNHLDGFARCQTFFSHYFISFLHTVVIYVVIVVIVSWISEGTPHAFVSFVLETVLCIVNDALYRTSLIMSNHWPVYSWLLSVRTQWQLPFCRIKHGDQVIFATTDLRDIDKGAQGQRLKSMGNLSWELVPHFQCVAQVASCIVTRILTSCWFQVQSTPASSTYHSSSVRESCPSWAVGVM